MRVVVLKLLALAIGEVTSANPTDVISATSIVFFITPPSNHNRHIRLNGFEIKEQLF